MKLDKDISLTCSLCEKYDKKEEFSDKDKKKIAEITKKTLCFMVEKGIPSVPKNYKRWFNVFTYLAEHGLLEEEIPEDKIFEIFSLINKKDKNVDIEKLKREIKNSTDSLKSSLDEIISVTDRYSKSLNRGDKVLSEAKCKIDDKNIQNMLGYILEEMKILKEENLKFRKKIEEENKKVQKLQEKLEIVETEANTDYLTGLYNRRAFMNILNNLFNDFKELNNKFSVILLDIDDFKKINDTYGHDVGDEVIKDIADVLRKYLRPEDIPARIGGEEFAVLITNADRDVAISVAERLRNVMENRHLFIDENTIIDYTASFGVASMDKDIDSPSELLKVADNNLYRAKKEGKNRVVG